MSAAAFAGNRALALRGPEVSDAILELLAVTLWGKLDYLLIDMPPGIGEEILDLARLIPTMEALVISTPSAASTSVVERLLSFLAEMKVVVAGVIANMVRGEAGARASAGTGAGGSADADAGGNVGADSGARTGAGASAHAGPESAASVREMAARYQVPFAGPVDYDPDIEAALGFPGRLSDSRSAAAVLAALRAADLIPGTRRRE
jgi:Mrp family chromosome partitioning ATPase